MLDTAWYAYRKKQRIHLIETFVKKRNKKTTKTTTTTLTYDENFPKHIFYLDIKIKQYKTLLSHFEIEGKSYNEIQKIFIEFCFNLNLITEEEFEYNKGLLLVDEL